MENDKEVNEIVDKIIENLEDSLGRLGQNLKLDQVPEPVQPEKPKEKEEIYSEEEDISNEQSQVLVREPFASVKYPMPEQVIKVENNYPKHTKILSDFEPIPNINKPKSEENEEVLKNEEIRVGTALIEKTPEMEPKIDIIIEDVKPFESKEIDEELYFLDFPKRAKLIHLFGPPGSAKTTLGLQSAIEIAPKKSYYFITSHATSVLKRIKQIIDNKRWYEYQSFKQSFYPIEISNLEVLEVQLDKLEEMSADEVGLVVIDHLTDYSRGQIHKEERRKQLRNLLERLYLLAENKDCKILIINGYSFKDSAPAEDIVESFCDMTIQTNIEDYQVKLILEENTVPLVLDDSGVKNLHVNVYY